ncbi:hypothetical protein CGJ15_25900, partial [Vibrio parahaemolyticus]
PRNVIDKSFKVARNTFYNPKRGNQPYSTKNMFVLPYHENLVDMPSLLKTFNIKVVFKNLDTVKKNF